MGVGKNAMEIFSVLDKSNCRECGEKTCLAFAGAVYLGKRRIEECTHLGREDITRFLQETGQPSRPEDELDVHMAEMIQQVMRLDFQEVAERIGAQVNGDVLSVPVLGKKFGIHRNGTFVTDIHINPWVVSPVLDYVLKCKGVSVAGEWISFREIDGGKEKYALFKKRGEDVLKQLGDKYPDFFNDIVHMFSGKSVEERFESDVSVILYPFPLVPVMICYWKPEEGLESSLNVFFDKTVDDNLGIDAAFFLGTGMAQMLEKLAEHHGF